MTKKHLIQLAKAYRELLRKAAGTFAFQGALATLETTIGILADSNPRFDETRFRAACGLTEGDPR
jgi:hypothetical protein